MTIKRALIKIANPEEGISREEYEALCKALGMEPKYGNAPTTPAAAAEGGPDSPSDAGLGLHQEAAGTEAHEVADTLVAVAVRPKAQIQGGTAEQATPPTRVAS